MFHLTVRGPFFGTASLLALRFSLCAWRYPLCSMSFARPRKMLFTGSVLASLNPNLWRSSWWIGRFAESSNWSRQSHKVCKSEPLLYSSRGSARPTSTYLEVDDMPHPPHNNQHTHALSLFSSVAKSWCWQWWGSLLSISFRFLNSTTAQLLPSQNRTHGSSPAHCSRYRCDGVGYRCGGVHGNSPKRLPCRCSCWEVLHHSHQTCTNDAV